MADNRLLFSDYLQQQGLDPNDMSPEDLQSWQTPFSQASAGQIGGGFDANGVLSYDQPGVTNPSDGYYEYRPPTDTQPLTTYQTGGGGGTSGGGTGGGGQMLGAPSFGYQAPSMLPLPNAPQFTAPGYQKPPAFSYKDFTAPTLDEALNDPGYKFRVGQGEQGLQNWAAARGTLNDSGTAKALLDYGQNAASQEYQNVWGRRANEYTMGRGNALDTYNTNYKTQYIDPYQISFQNAQAEFAPKMAEYSTTAAWNQHANDQSQALAWNSLLNDEDQYWKKIDWGTANA